MGYQKAQEKCYTHSYGYFKRKSERIMSIAPWTNTADGCIREMFDEHSTKSSETFLQHWVEHAPFSIFEIQTDNGTEFAKRLLTQDETDLTLFETLMANTAFAIIEFAPQR